MIAPDEMENMVPPAVDAPDVDWVVRSAATHAMRVLELIKERGDSYGEEVLALVGERGLVTMAVTKSMRAQWSVDQGRPFEDRQDSWLDLAGYALLALAIEQWEKETNDGKEGK